MQFLKVEIVDSCTVYKLPFKLPRTNLLPFKVNISKGDRQTFPIFSSNAPTIRQLVYVVCSLSHGEEEDSFLFERDLNGVEDWQDLTGKNSSFGCIDKCIDSLRIVWHPRDSTIVLHAD